MRSFEKVNYMIRPSKQVERKLFIEALHRIRGDDYQISDYTYIGFGSVYFADFILFHKYLFIDKMICVEREEIQRRMTFNKPYRFIDLRMQPLCDVIPTLDDETTYLAWLDYDVPLNKDVMDDIDGMLQMVGRRSIIIVTVDARPRLPESLEDLSWSESDRKLHALDYFQEQFQKYREKRIGADDLTEARFPTVLNEIIQGRISESVLGRSGLSFSRMFNFYYSDNAPMVTIGGILEEPMKAGRLWRRCLRRVPFMTQSMEPIKISVPALTERERSWIDQRVAGGKRTRLPFEIGKGVIKKYSQFARYYPRYYEAVL